MVTAQRPMQDSKEKGRIYRMKFFTEPEMEIQKFAVEDIITSSDLGDYELPPVSPELGMNELPPA